MGFSAVIKGNHSHVVFLNTTLHVCAVTNSSKVPWHKYLKRQYFHNSHHYNPPTSLSPTLDNMKFVTDLMVGLRNNNERFELYLGKWSEVSGLNTVLVSVENWFYSYCLFYY